MIQCWVSWGQFNKLDCKNFISFTKFIFLWLNFFLPLINPPFSTSQAQARVCKTFIYLKALYLWPFLSTPTFQRKQLYSFRKILFGCYSVGLSFWCSFVSWCFHFNLKLDFVCLFPLKRGNICSQNHVCTWWFKSTFLTFLAATEETQQILAMRFFLSIKITITHSSVFLCSLTSNEQVFFSLQVQLKNW